MNYIEWVDLVQQLLAAQWQRDPRPFALDVIRMLPAVQANTRTLEDRRAADPFMCAREDLIARGILHPDADHAQLYQYRSATLPAGMNGSAPPAAPPLTEQQTQFLAALIQSSQMEQGPRVWLHWCGVEEICQALGWGAASAVAHLETAIIGPLEEGGLVRSYPAPGEMRFRPTYQGMRVALLPAPA